MPQNFFEGATVTITDPEGAAPGSKMTQKKFFGNRPYSGPAVVEFLRGDDQTVFETKNVTIKSGKLTAPVMQVMPAVKPTEASYDVRVTCKYKNQTKLMLFCTIWPKQVKVLFQDPGKQPAKSFAFFLKQKGVEDQDLVSGTDGKSTIDLLVRGPYSLEPKNKFKVQKDEQVTPSQFRDHKITVETVITARFLSPDITKDIYLDDPDASPAKKQWINLKSKEAEHAIDSGCDAKGHTVVFAVTADPPEEGQPGDKIYFEINFGKESKRNDPPPKLLDGWGGNELTVLEKKTTGYVILAPVGDAMTGYFEVDLGEAGGDTCEVKIGGTAAVGDAELKLINWRKIYAQVTRTAGLAKPSLVPAQDCFKKVQIDLEDAPADEVIIPDDEVPDGGIVDGSHIRKGAPAQCLVVGDHNVEFFQAKLNARFQASNLPVAHLIYCDIQVDAYNPDYTNTYRIRGKSKDQTQSLRKFPGDTDLTPGVKISAKKINGSALFFPIDLFDGENAVKSCTWTEVGGGGNSGSIPEVDYMIDPVNNGNYLHVRLPDAAKGLSDGGADIKVTVKVAYALGWYAGWCTSGDRHNVVRVGRPDQDVCHTIVHEVGHAIFQAAVAPAAFPGLPAPPHERYYTNNRGHLGPHCADGVDQATYEDESIPLDTVAAQNKCTCVMFGAAAAVTIQNLSFCDKCVPYVRAAVIKTVST